jgi:single-stranded DNA-specific DHH superfamily exonuclease
MEKMIPDRNKRISIFNHLLPYVAIATIADCVPLTNENRVIVKQ